MVDFLSPRRFPKSVKDKFNSSLTCLSLRPTDFLSGLSISNISYLLDHYNTGVYKIVHFLEITLDIVYDIVYNYWRALGLLKKFYTIRT